MKSEKSRFSLTIADLLIIALLVFVGFFAYRYAFSDASDDSYEIDYVVKVSAVRSELATGRIAAGDSVYTRNGEYMGRVTACETTAAVLGETGQTLPDRYDIYITIEADADSSGRVGGYEIYAERTFEMYTTGLSFDCVCIDVRR